MTETIEQSILAIVPQLVEIRRALHRRPELSGKESETAAFVANRLRSFGSEVQTGVGGHGVVAVIKGGRPGPTLALRADMDALPIQEEGLATYRSERDGVMHACGHDGHTTMLLGAAHVLADVRDTIAGEVRLLFQPAEETDEGAAAMCAFGAMDGADSVYALHAWPGLPVGQVGLRAGAMTASEDEFEIIVQGQGGHAAYPHLCIDPVVTAAQIVTALQTLVSREVAPMHPAVVTVAQFHAGTANNVIPDTARLAGTIRTQSAEVRNAMPDRVRRVAEAVCASMRATCRVDFRIGTPGVINDPRCAELASAAASDILGAENVIALPHATMGAEDFARYLDYAPGAILRLGIGSPTPLHSPQFDFNDDALIVGVRTLVAIALRTLSAG